jgi:hypothetical protein
MMGVLESLDADQATIAATVQMLRMLNTPTHDVLATFISGREVYMRALMREARKEALLVEQWAEYRAAGSAGQRTEVPWSGLQDFVQSLGDRVFPCLSQVYRTSR